METRESNHLGAQSTLNPRRPPPLLASNLYSLLPPPPQISDVTTHLAFTRYCHDQYCVVYIAMTGGRGGLTIVLRNSVAGDGDVCARAKGWCAQNGIGSCKRAHAQHNILYRPNHAPVCTQPALLYSELSDLRRGARVAEVETAAVLAPRGYSGSGTPASETTSGTASKTTSGTTSSP